MITKIKTAISAISNGKWGFLIQFIKFGIVGASNTCISYGVEMLFYYLIFRSVPWNDNLKIIVVTFFSFFISVTNSYFWNHRYVFSADKNMSFKRHLITYFKMVLCYGLTGLILSPLMKMGLTSIDVSYWLTSIIVLIISVPLNFILNKFWAFSKKQHLK